jgi:hypothetical protein
MFDVEVKGIDMGTKDMICPVVPRARHNCPYGTMKKTYDPICDPEMGSKS